MAVYRDVKPVRTIMGTLEHGADLLQELTSLCKAEDIRLGRIEAIGAAWAARIGFYDQSDHEYQILETERPLQITKLIGNVSVQDGEPVVHAHVTLTDEDGHAFGGHLEPGTIVFSCEFILQAFEGPEFSRAPDDKTGLPEWTFDA